MPRVLDKAKSRSLDTKPARGTTAKTVARKGTMRIAAEATAGAKGERRDTHSPPATLARKTVVTWFSGGRSRKVEYAEVFKADPMVRIQAIKKGIPAAYVVRVANDLHVTQEQLTRSLGLPFSTISRKVRSGQNLTTDQAERLVGLSRLVGQVQTMVEQSGDPAGFDAAEWVGKWIARPNPALGGQRPVEFMDTAEGQDIVGGLLAKMSSGAAA